MLRLDEMYEFYIWTCVVELDEMSLVSVSWMVYMWIYVSYVDYIACVVDLIYIYACDLIYMPVIAACDDLVVIRPGMYTIQQAEKKTK
jgi:hypothetical protein